MISDAVWRTRCCITGKVHAMRVQPMAGVATLECTLADDSGRITVIFLGRREIPGIHLGVQLTVEGMVGAHKGRMAIIDPAYEFPA